MKSTSPAVILTACAVAIALALPLAALAQSADDYALVGAGVRSRPAYDGSASQRADLIPALRYYGRPWFARTTQGILEGGARAQLAPGLALGAQIAYEPGRSASESDFLRDHGVADLDAGASYGLHLEWDKKLGRMPINLLARTRQHTDSDRGAQADFRLTAGIYGEGRLAAGVFTQLTWANAKSARSFYGVTREQSGATRLPAFDPGSGVLFASFGLLGSFDLSRQWVLLGSLEGRRLRGDAARSPLAERTSNHYASASLAYRF